MAQNKAQKSLLKIPRIVKTMERNRSIASARLRKLATLQLVYISSAGPGGGAPTSDYGEQVLQEEVDKAIDDLQELLDKQQEALSALGGTSSGKGGSSEDKPCQTFLIEYQTAVKAKDKKNAAKYLNQYSNCMRIQAGAGPKPKPQSR